MFSDQYKKENEQLTLDNDFIEQLKQRMRQEQARLQIEQTKNETVATKESSCDNRSNNNGESSHRNPSWKKILPLALASCAAVCLITVIPFSLSTNRKSASSMDTEASMNIANTDLEFEESNETTESCEEESFLLDEEQKFSINTTESATGTSDESIITMENTNTSNSYELSRDEVSKRLKSDVLPRIDAYYSNHIVFHNESVLFVYDLMNSELIHLINLEEMIGAYELYGNQSILIECTTDETAILISKQVDDTTTEYYIYSFDTEQFDTIEESEYHAYDVMNMSQMLSDDTTIFDQLTYASNQSNQCIKLDNNSSYILYYQCLEDDTILSLSVYQAVLDEDKTIINSSIYPIFGEESIEELLQKKYTFSGNIN